jgi:hypothetical protein
MKYIYVYLFIKRSTNLFRERLLDLFLETKRRENLFNKFKESEKELRKSDDNVLNDESDDDHDGRTCKTSFILIIKKKCYSYFFFMFSCSS